MYVVPRLGGHASRILDSVSYLQAQLKDAPARELDKSYNAKPLTMMALDSFRT